MVASVARFTSVVYFPEKGEGGRGGGEVEMVEGEMGWISPYNFPTSRETSVGETPIKKYLANMNKRGQPF